LRSRSSAGGRIQRVIVAPVVRSRPQQPTRGEQRQDRAGWYQGMNRVLS